jgi:hypothetical protein
MTYFRRTWLTKTPLAVDVTVALSTSSIRCHHQDSRHKPVYSGEPRASHGHQAGLAKAASCLGANRRETAQCLAHQHDAHRRWQFLSLPTRGCSKGIRRGRGRSRARGNQFQRRLPQWPAAPHAEMVPAGSGRKSASHSKLENTDPQPEEGNTSLLRRPAIVRGPRAECCPSHSCAFWRTR